MSESTAARATEMPSPMIISDCFGKQVQSMADGKYYDSKRALSASHRAGGFDEVGTEPPRARPQIEPKGIEQSIKTALEKVHGI